MINQRPRYLRNVSTTFLLSLLAVLVFPATVFSQQKAISGVVKNEINEVLSGATIKNVATNAGTFANADGIFNISAAPSEVLEISYVGYNTEFITVGEQKNITVILTPSVNAGLSDVVVIGYGTQKITNVSGAIATIKSADIEKLRPVRPEEAIQGRAAGVNIIQSGSPGSKPTVLVRGIPSFSGTDPVVVIDGVPQSLNDFNSINAVDIENINVLKDAATTAIYGVKGGNGVIVVTTKSGRKNLKPEITFSANYGIQEVVKKIDMLNASEYAGMINEGSVASGANIIFPDLSLMGEGTDWQKEVFKTPADQTYNLGLRGGSDNVSYFLSAGYLSQGGIVGGYDKSRFNRTNLTANMDFKITSKLKLILNNTYVLLNSRGVQENSFNSILGSALNFDPTVPVFNTDPAVKSTYGYSNLILSEVFNPLTKLENTHNRNTGNKLYGKAELQFDILSNLKFTSRFGYTKYDDNAKSFTPLVFYGPLNVENTMDAGGNRIEGRHNQVSHTKNSNQNFTFENFTNYNFTLQNVHNFETVLGMSIAKTSGNAASATRQDVPFNSWIFADFTAATGANTSDNPNAVTGSYYQYFRKNLSYFGRILYDYNDKYLASFSLRRDGSYAFGPDNKFGNFFAGSLGWVVSKEDFFRSDFINFLKIRGSYGSSGNENVNPQLVSIITGGPSYDPMANSNGYTFGEVFIPGSTIGSAANTALRWEKQSQVNMGFDMSLLKNKLSLSADYYQKHVDGLLFTPSVSLYLGTVPIPTANIGTTKSSGIDVSLNYREKFGRDFLFNTSLAFTTVKSLVTATNDDGTARIVGGSYFNGQSQTVSVFEKDMPPGYFYGYKTNGLFQSADDVNNWARQDGARPGDIRYADLNGDSIINAQDQTKIGNPFPDFTLGWNINMEYKNFDFTIFTYASVGNDIYKAYDRNANYTNKTRDILNRWTGPNTTNDARYPRYSFTDNNNNARVSDRYVEDGSFVKIKNIQLGYNFSKALLRNTFSGVRLYAQVKNAFTFTNYSGYDPEISGGIMSTGIDYGTYPQARSYSVGLNIKL